MKTLAHTKQLPIAQVLCSPEGSKRTRVNLVFNIPRGLGNYLEKHINTGFFLHNIPKDQIPSFLMEHFGIPTNLIQWI